MYTIVPQFEGRGEKKTEVLVKRLTKIPGKKVEGQQQFLPINFPLLKIIIESNRDNCGEQYVLTWSNFTKETKKDAGKFTLKRFEIKPIIIYEKNINGRVMTMNGKKVVDYMTMAMKYFTFLNDDRTLSFGKYHPMEKTIVWEQSFETLDMAEEKMIQYFGNDIADNALSLIVEHELYVNHMSEVCV